MTSCCFSSTAATVAKDLLSLGSAKLETEWEDSLSRLAASKCRSAETATIQPAVKSAQDLHQFAAEKG